MEIAGYPQGSVSPLCLPDEVPVIFDTRIAACVRVNISSGDPMGGLELYAKDLIRLAGASIAPIAEVE